MISRDNNVIFAAVNFHTADCGVAPSVRDDGADGKYWGYFQNRHGEQWILAVDRATKTGLLRGGDIGWEREVKIVDGCVDDLILVLKSVNGSMRAGWRLVVSP